MAYKFQTLAATMSGSLTQEGTFTVKNDAGTTAFTATDAGVVSGSGNFSAGGTVSLLGVADASIANAADSLYFKDATDGLVKSEAVSDFVSGIAGPGLAEVGGALELDIDEFSALGGATVAQGDNFLVSDGGTEKKVTFSNLEDSIFGNVSGDATVAAGGALTIAAGAVEHGMLAEDIISGQGELAQGSLAAADELMISDGGTIKRYGVDSLAKDALALTTEAAMAVADDYVVFLDGGASGETKKEAWSDLIAAAAGDGLTASGGILAMSTSGSSLAVSSDKLGISGSIAGTGLTYTGGVDSILTIGLDIDGLAALGGTGVAQGDHFVFSDGGTEKKITASNLEDWMFGNVSGDATIAAGGALTIAAGAVEHGMLAEDIISGQDELAHADIADADELMISDAGTIKRVGVDSIRDHFFGVVSGDATVADGGALTIANDAIETAMLNDNVISGQTELAQAGLAAADELLISDGGTLKRYGVDSLAKDALALTTEAAAAVANDYIVFLDGGATGETKKESIADLVASMAGAGLSAASGQLSVTGNNVSLKADSGTLVEGYNYFADASSNATVTMPAAPAVGDVVVVKAGNLTSNAIITVNKGSADHRIDGLEAIVLESPFAAVTMVYVVADHWKIV